MAKKSLYYITALQNDEILALQNEEISALQNEEISVLQWDLSYSCFSLLDCETRTGAS